MHNKLLTVKEVALVLQVSVATVHGYIHNGKLIAIKFARDYRIDKKDLDKFLREHKYHA